MKNNKGIELVQVVILTFACSDLRMRSSILLNIIEESNQSLGCFHLLDYQVRPDGTIHEFKIKLSYADLAGMLTRFAWLMRDINNDAGYVFWLKSTDLEVSETTVITGSNNLIIGGSSGNSIAVTNTATNSTFTKIKRKKWNY